MTPTSAMVLEVAMIVPLDLLPSAPTVTILLNEKVLEEIAVGEKDITRRYEVSAEHAKGAQVRIQTSQTFVPSERNTSSPDTRRLGLIVRSVQWTPRQ